MDRGFTVFELLVTTGVAGLLLVFLVPAASNAMGAARDAKCKANLRTLALLAHEYAMDKGRFPWGMIDPMSHDENYCKRYGANNEFMMYPEESPALVDAKSWMEFESYCWDFTKRKGELGHKPGRMFPPGMVTVQGCPCCADSDNWDGERITGYNYNVCYIGLCENDATIRKLPARWDSLKYPERVVIFGDGGYSGGANKFMRAPRQSSSDKSSASLRKAGTQAFRHGNGRGRHCNMAFADGHVESFYTPYKTNGKDGWVDEKTHSAFISSGNGIYGPRAWGEPDDFTENK